jgi:hypothetical protein
MTALDRPKTFEAIRAKVKDIRPLALDCLAKEAIAKVVREQVDTVQRRLLLGGCPLFADLDGGYRIIDPEKTYLSQDEDAWKAYEAAQNRELRDAGIKPPEMDDEFCPALVAEHQEVLARRAFLAAMAPLFGVNPSNLLCSHQDRVKEFFELAMALVLKA